MNGKFTVSFRDLWVYGVLLLTTAGYWGYSGFPHFSASGQGIHGFFPQALGMLSSSLIIFLIGRHKSRGSDPAGLKNITSGLIFSVAAGTYLVSLQLNGLVNAFVLTQMNVVISTVLGIVILKEAQTKDVTRNCIGLGIVIVSAMFMVQI